MASSGFYFGEYKKNTLGCRGSGDDMRQYLTRWEQDWAGGWLVQVNWPDVAECTQRFNKHTWRTYSPRMAACQFGSILGVKQKGYE